MFGRRREPAFEEVGASFELIRCRVCNSGYMGRNEAWDCAESDMIRFIYTKLGGTFIEPADRTNSSLSEREP